MTKEITSALAMSHPTVVATINVLSEMTQRLQDENDELKAALAKPEPDDLTIAYMSGVAAGKKQERALWTLTKLGQEIEAQPALCKYGNEIKSCTSDPMNCQCSHDALNEMTENDEEIEAKPEQKWVYGTPLLDAMSKEYVALERSFCQRCGKRIGGDVNDIHTCTPPNK